MPGGRTRVVLGIDPGLASTGIGIIRDEDRSLVPVMYDCIRTSPGPALPDRLAAINRAIKRILRKYRPDVVAMERLFFSRNVKTAMVVGQAQGAVLLAMAGKGLEVFQYTPKDVKMCVTGDGGAGKDDVALMVKRLLKLKETPRPDDAADALAVAYCHIVSTARLGKRR